jgi:hypothetical protein
LHALPVGRLQICHSDLDGFKAPEKAKPAKLAKKVAAF